MSRDERPLAQVPRWLWVSLATALCAQLAWQSLQRPAPPAAVDLPPAPTASALRLASLGEPEAAARVFMLYLQAFDLAAGNALPYRALDYERLIGWLRAILALDPRSEYPLFSAARLYAEVPDPEKSRRMLEFIHDEYLKDPNRRWQWLAHAALVAKHRLKDLPLASRYAASLDRHTTSPEVPLWAKHMQVFILEEMNEFEAARIMLGGLLESGAVKDPAELRFLRQRLEALAVEAETARSGR